MKIKSIILNILFIVILICLIYFFIYLNNSNFENFYDIPDCCAFSNQQCSDGTKCPEITVKGSEVNNNVVNGLSIQNSKSEPVKGDGFSFDTPLPSADFGYILQKVANTDISEDKFVPQYKDGYYWINLPIEGTKYIYCIMDTNYWGGGWMLALRSVYNSRNFSYNSSYFTKANTLNDNSKKIDNIIKDIPKEDFNISSIGKKIYDENLDPNIYDAKFETFNYSKAVEWMAIFYVKNPKIADKDLKNQKIIGGDMLLNNTKGWIWREKNVKKPNNDGSSGTEPISPLELFVQLDALQSKSPASMNGRRNLAPIYMEKQRSEYAQNITGKFLNYSPEELTKNDKKINQIWSSQPKKNGKSFYGINYNDSSAANGKSLVRWGFTFNDVSTDDTNDVYAGIGLSYGGEDENGVALPNMKGFSAGNFESKGKDPNKFDVHPLHEILRNRSYAVEWYVREKNYCA